MLSPTVWIGPARNVARNEDAGAARFQIRIHHDTAIEREPGLLGQRQARPHAYTYDHKVGFEHAATFERRTPAIDRDNRIFKMEDDTMLLVERAYKIAHLGSEHAFHWPSFRRDHMDLDIARAQCGRDLKPDKAGAEHDCSARGFGTLNNGPAVGKRTQRADVRLIGARDRQSDGLGSVACSSRS